MVKFRNMSAVISWKWKCNYFAFHWCKLFPIAYLWMHTWPSVSGSAILAGKKVLNSLCSLTHVRGASSQGKWIIKLCFLLSENLLKIGVWQRRYSCFINLKPFCSLAWMEDVSWPGEDTITFWCRSWWIQKLLSLLFEIVRKHVFPHFHSFLQKL